MNPAASHPAPPRSRLGFRLAVLAGLVVVAATAATGLQRATTLRQQWPAEADTLYLPTARTLQLLSLGHTELAAGLIAARANVYFGTQLTQKRPQKWLARYLNTAVDLDPRFKRVYLSGAPMLVYSDRKIRPENVIAANELLARGIRQFPYEWELYFQLGFNNLFELPKLVSETDPRVARWRQDGAEALRQAALFDDVPAWLPNLAARMLTKRGSEELAIKHLEQAYAVASTEEARNHIRQKLAQLHSAQFSQQLEEERVRFEAMVKSRYPDAPDAFSVIAGPRRKRAVTFDRLPTKNAEQAK